MNPDKRYQSARQVRRAFSYGKRCALYGCAALLLAAFVWTALSHQPAEQEDVQSAEDSNTVSVEPGDREAEGDDLIVLSAPENPHWDGETGVAVWGNVPESGDGGGEEGYYWKLYRRDTPAPPNPDVDTWDEEGSMWGNGMIDEATSTYAVNIASELWENGYYYFAVAAAGDGVTYGDSPYVVSDAFWYTGEFAPTLPAPTGLEWRMFDSEEERVYYATWSNLEDYADTDSFRITVYDKDGNHVMNNIWTKKQIMERGYGGIRVRKEFLTEIGGAYRFTVEAYTSRPNEYKSFLMPDPVPEEYFSPWYNR